MLSATVWGLAIVAFGSCDTLGPAFAFLAIAGSADGMSGVFRFLSIKGDRYRKPSMR